MMRSFLYTLSWFTAIYFLFSCSSKKSSSDEIDSLGADSDTTSIIDQRFYKIEPYLVTESIDAKDEEVFASDCALLIRPTAEQVTAMIKEYGEEDFTTIADDNAWYHSNANMLLDSIGIRVIIPSTRYARLVGMNKKWLLDLRRKGALPWNLIFFNTTKGPQVFSTVDLTADQIREYFQLKPLPEFAENMFKKYASRYSLGDGLSQQFLQADFSGDGKQDIAIWVERKEDRKKGVLFFFEEQSEPVVVGAGKEFGNAGDDFKWAGIWEIVDAKVTKETTFDKEGDVSGSKDVALERPAISIRESEGSGGLIYYDGKKFIWIHQGD
jgi:hypothetical protein